MNLRIVSKVLGAIFSDVRVEFAHDGREGIKRFEELRNDASCELALIIVDYNMPCCDGVTASKYMRALEERRNGSRARAIRRRRPLAASAHRDVHNRTTRHSAGFGRWHD